MTRGYAHIPEKDFQEIYTWLSYFTRVYDNGEKYVPFVLDSIVDAFIESKKSQHKFISKEEAHNLLSTIPRNVRGAGRKPRYTEEDLLGMEHMYDSGKPVKDIASSFKCSETYVRKIITKHLKTK